MPVYGSNGVKTAGQYAIHQCVDAAHTKEEKKSRTFAFAPNPPLAHNRKKNSSKGTNKTIARPAEEAFCFFLVVHDPIQVKSIGKVFAVLPAYAQAQTEMISFLL